MSDRCVVMDGWSINRCELAAGHKGNHEFLVPWVHPDGSIRPTPPPATPPATKTKTYQVNEVFYSVQGEGLLAGTPMVFVRFSKCNLACRIEPGDKSPGGFDCDTEFESGRRVTLLELELWVQEERGVPVYATDRWLLLTGGEPGLQVDAEFLDFWKARNWRIAIETNGTILLPHVPCKIEDATVDHLGAVFPLFDHITVSPKVAEHAVRQLWAHEVRYVRAAGQDIPQTRVRALHQFISPASGGDELDRRSIAWCMDLVLRNPTWRISVQQHKAWRVR